MGDPVTINLRHVARGLGIPLGQVQAVLELLDEGNTVPFITRYRKDQTGALDEEQIRQIQARLNKLRLLAERKQTILRSIESQGKLTERLSKQIRNASTAKRLEDLYLPYKPKKQTLATIARSRGLEPLANEILAAEKGCADLDFRAADFVNPDRQVPTAADALLGAGHIIAEQFSERADLRQRLREILYRSGKLASTQAGGESKMTSEKEARGISEKADSAKAGKAQAAEAPGTDAESSTAQPRQAEDPATPQSEKAPEHATGRPSPHPGGQSSEQAGRQAPEQAVDQASGESVDQRSPSLGAEQPPATPPPSNNPDDANTAPEPSADPQDDVPRPTETQPQGEPNSEPDAKATAPTETEAEVAKSDQPHGEVQHAEDVVAEPPQAAEVNAEPEPSCAVKAESDQQPAEAEADLKQPAEAQAGQAEAGQAKGHAPAAPRAKPQQVKADRRLSKKEQKKKKADEKRQKAFRDYFDYHEEIKKIPPHRVLAINRGERAKFLRVKIECDVEAMHAALDEICVPQDHPHAEFLRGCARDALARLILPGLEREARRELTDRAETHAVSVFARNLRNLLLQPPIRGRRVLAVDPGYRSGCKLAALDQFGNLLAHDVIYLVGRPERKEEAKRIVADLVDRFQLTVVTIGNGTACREAEDFFGGLIADELKDRGLAYVIVNEAGASVYSTSRIGREEFPDYDASLRGAISIGRRLQDPLSELVKIDPANIGVGLYQHDVKAKHLQDSLDEVVESCVNYVGVDVNTASPALLRYVSGLNQLTARRLYEHRCEHGPFRNREQLREVPGFGEATFVQAAGFLKISGGDNPLDATWIHPESYDAASRVMSKLGGSPADLNRKEAAEILRARTSQVEVAALAEEVHVGELLLKDILAQLVRPGRDPREDLPPPVFKQGVLKLEDLSPGMELTGTVLNVVDFGAFVDIGMHDSGLVHVSQLADRFVRDPHDVIAVGDVVKVWVVEVDKQRRRVSLTMIPPGTRRAPGRPDRKSAPRRPDDRPERPAAHEQARPERRPRPKGPPRGRPKGPPKPRYKPKSRAKPVTPITDEMKTGKEPMRSFSDLAQFFQGREPGPQEGGRKPKPKFPKEKPQTRKDEAQAGKDEPQSSKVQPPTDEAQGLPTGDEKTPDQAPIDQAEAQAAEPEPQTAPPAAERPQDEPQAPKDEPQQPQGKQETTEDEAESTNP